ncbi:calcium-translocating P-type ATPase, PMCA-type [Barnesiella sp. An55]|uniref:calcium-translocating P-type ATPase, PMCA-type n=1 Tax=Barnesiella sp. An55 TaxID=1965646 RepID=UPI000B374881|nr:calcium-translocating P-type ATPase, PMCA-type [Barnesiella sp. An55]OUN72104.1 calcium-translocating P-type ATPase, PMCA-type [Barnesiella sp. An55]HIZ26003.1 calcium-translocating P-type ATPase, PMCA-type [Candidatus Barnesiella merdipullorum]
MSSKLEYTGLSEAEVLKSREKYGENVLTPPARTPMWKLFLEKFSDPIIRILLVALLLSIAVAVYHVATGEAGLSALFEPAGIALAILLATVVGFLFEMSAARKFDILNQVNDDLPVKVVRGGHILEIPKRDIVVGDIVMLNAGDEIPADGILLSAVSMQVNESSLTGEPMATKTTVEADFDKEATYPSNAVMNGSTMLGGYGVMRVTQVGDATEYGKVYTGSQIENNTQTPLDKQLNTLAAFITKASYVIAAIIFIARTVIYLTDHPELDWLNFGSYLLSTAMIAVTVIVVAVPEGLPMSVTLSLAMSMKRMLANNNLVRKMHACETMGAATVICTDKTGTLTQNQMRVSEAAFDYAPDSNIKEIIFEGIAANSTAHLDEGANGVKVLGNPTEGALLLWMADQGIDYAGLRNEAHVVEQLTFSTERKYMATVVDSPLLNHRVIYVKGAPEYVMNFCSQMVTAQGLVPMDSRRPAVEEKLLQYQNQAMRTLGFAYALVDDDGPYFLAGHLAPHIRLTFLGVTAIADPVRKEVPAAVADCLKAGIKVKIVTGDTPATAREIARQISLWQPEDGDRNIITGPEFANLDDKTLLERIPDLKVIARARPMDKERLVKLLQSQDEVVAVTGDGTNDAPALNAAQVGLSMGDGTSVAKEASDITIIDNSFGSITKAVLWGRSLYRNIQKFILFQMTINVAACLIVLIGAFLGTESPLTVTQMLWVNLIMDTFAALALASLPPDERVMRDKPRHLNDNIVTRAMGKGIIGTGIAFVLLLFGLLQYFKHVDVTSIAQFDLRLFLGNFFNFTPVPDGLTRYELTLFFSIFVFLQFWNMFNAKAFGNVQSAFSRLASCKGFLWVTLIILAGQILIVSVGGSLFGVTPLQPMDWLYIFAGTSIVLWIGEIYRLIRRLMA